MHIRVKHKTEFKRLQDELTYAEHKVALTRRLLDSWERHAFTLNQLSKNVAVEVGAYKQDFS